LFYDWQQTKTRNRILKILEANNIKLRSVISSMHTVTAMGLVRLLAKGVTDKEQLLKCAKGRAIPKKEQLAMALEGTLTASHCLQMQMLLEDFDHVEKQINRLDTLISGIIKKYYNEELQCLDSISGIGIKSAEVILAEVGKDMTRFPSADHFTAWCGVAPGNNESAGKRKGSAVKKGNSYLRVAIIQASWAAVRLKDSYWHALFDRLRKRMKAQKAIVAIARRLLKVVYRTIGTLTIYEEKGVAHFVAIQARNLQWVRPKP